MDYEKIKENESKPVRLFLKDNKTFYYGTYTFTDNNTISFTDRRRKSFPIDISVIGVIEPVDSIKYTPEGENEKEI